MSERYLTWPRVIASVVSDICLLGIVALLAQCASDGKIW